jgi:chromosome segregation ATPase
MEHCLHCELPKLLQDRIAELESQITELQRDMEYRDGYLTKLEQRAALLEEECDVLRRYRENAQKHFLNMGW